MVHPVSIQHLLTNSSSAEKVQQSNYTQTDGQQKHLATKPQKEKRLKRRKIHETEKSDQIKIKKEQEKQKRQDLSHQKPKENHPEGDRDSDGSRPEGTPKIDILV